MNHVFVMATVLKTNIKKGAYSSLYALQPTTAENKTISNDSKVFMDFY